MSFKFQCDNLVASLVLNKVGTYNEVLNMDFENAINTYSIFYINSINEALAIEYAQARNKK